MKIRWTTVYVTDQEKALRFYTDVLGFELNYGDAAYFKEDDARARETETRDADKDALRKANNGI